MGGFTPSRACARFHAGLCFKSIYFIVYPMILAAESESPDTNCADAQADLGLFCQHVLRDTFSHGPVHVLPAEIPFSLHKIRIYTELKEMPFCKIKEENKIGKECKILIIHTF